jgi:hypothetical protein
VVWDIEPKRRRIYKLWEEGKGPTVVFEVTSKSTRREDFGKKMCLLDDAEARDLAEAKARDAQQHTADEQRRADDEQRRAHAERQRAELAEAEVTRLRAELARLRAQS